MPYFVWFGILGILLVAAAAIIMGVAKRNKKLVHLRRYHAPIGVSAAVSLTVHAVWANVRNWGEPLPPFGWVGILGLAGVYFAYFAMLQARKTGDARWRQVHWISGLGSLVIMTVHAAWFLSRILQG